MIKRRDILLLRKENDFQILGRTTEINIIGEKKIENHQHAGEYTTKQISPTTPATFSTVPTCVTKKRKREHVCSYPECGKMYSTKGNLKTHGRKHKGDMPFKCTFLNCGKVYSEYCRLVTHSRTHTGDQPFKCKYCDKRFNERGNLKTHERIHTGQRPFVCAVPGCTAKFKAKGHLIDHARSHVKLKPYKCNICSKMYTRSSTLKSHIKKFHFVQSPLSHNDALVSDTYSNQRKLIGENSPKIKKKENESHNESTNNISISTQVQFRDEDYNSLIENRNSENCETDKFWESFQKY